MPFQPTIVTQTVEMMDALRKNSDAHKYSYGHALILTGGAGRTGAARLAARGALRIGAGLVTLAVPPAAQFEVACQITALMLVRCADGAALAEILADQRINALCLGPGMGVARAAAALDTVLAGGALKARLTVLDADALSALAADANLMERLHGACILTPHEGEFSRLFPDIDLGLGLAHRKESRVEATCAAAARVGCAVVLKGPDTVIAMPDGRCAVHSARAGKWVPWLATAGAGDVLAGFVTGLLARGLPMLQAAETAVWLHAECARGIGPGLIAEDLPEALPQVFRALGV